MFEILKLLSALLFKNHDINKRIEFLLYLSECDLKYTNFIKKMNEINNDEIKYLNELYVYYLIKNECITKLEYDIYNNNFY